MRASAHRLLAEDTEPPSPEELQTLTLQLSAYLVLAVPLVEAAALALSADSVPRACAMFCVADARLRLSVEPRHSLSARTAHARRLAQSVHALCDHYEDVDHQCPSAPERAAYLRMLEHYPGCPACRIAQDHGEGSGLCPTGDRLYEEYRQARRGPALQRRQPRPDTGGC
jgi:hypothetical protein